nr:hypothetical protein [uncultured Desulfobulbus sp.]
MSQSGPVAAAGRKNRRRSRFVAVEGRLVEDGHKKMSGKGIYCCDQENCRNRMAKKSKKVLRLG